MHSSLAETIFITRVLCCPRLEEMGGGERQEKGTVYWRGGGRGEEKGECKRGER